MKAVWRYTSPRFLDQENTVFDDRGFLWKRDAYSLVDLTLVKHLKLKGSLIENLDFTLSVENLLDDHYGEWFFYRNHGRTIRGEVVVRF